MIGDIQKEPAELAPFFTVVIPMYNRAREIRRALGSCLSQDFRDYEIVVVDDCSSDDSVRVVESFRDRRVRCIRSPSRCGPSNARRLGAQGARAEWVIFLDSDDALLGHALNTLFQLASAESCEVHRLLLPYTRSDGSIQTIGTESAILPYVEWLTLWGKNAVPDLFSCTRRSAFEELSPSSWAGETLYSLDCAARLKSRYVPISVARVYEDAANRMTAAGYKLALPALSQSAQTVLTEILIRHGLALRKYAPKAYRSQSRLLILEFMKTHSYGSAARHMLTHLKTFPSDFFPATCAALGPQVFGTLSNLTSRIAAWRRKALAAAFSHPHLPSQATADKPALARGHARQHDE